MTPNATTTPNERFSNIGRAGPDIRDALACGILRHRGGQSSSSVCCSVAARCVRGGSAGGFPGSGVKNTSTVRHARGECDEDKNCGEMFSANEGRLR